MTERPPRPEISAFLHDRAQSLDHEAAPVTADDATRRSIVDVSKPRRQWVFGPHPAKGRTSARSALAAAAVAALVIGALGGFVIGRSSAPKHSTVATAEAPGSDSAAVPTTTTPWVVANGATGTASAFGFGQTGAPMTRLFDRTTPDGVAIHAFQQDQSGSSVTPDVACATTIAPGGVATTVTSPTGTNQPTCAPSAWTPPAECHSTGLFVEAANQGAVGQSGSPGYPLHDFAVVTAPIRFGEAEDSPANGFIVNVNEQVAKVEAKWADGFVDSTNPTTGWAVVAHNGASPDATITAFSNTGATLKTITAGATSYVQPPAECSPPPPAPAALPAAGEQPDDPTAAKQSITNAYQTVFTHGSDAMTNAKFVEDPDSIQQALDMARSNFPQAVDTVTVKVGEIVFTSKTEAALYFELDYQGGAEFGQQIGYAKLIDGSWKISHATMCMVLGWAGGQCDGGSGSSPGAPPATPLTTVPNN